MLAVGTASAAVYGAEDGALLHTVALHAAPPAALVALAPGRWLLGDDKVGATRPQGLLPRF